MHLLGEFYSWTVINEYVAIKKGDRSFFEHSGSGIPKEIKWFFLAEEMKYGDKTDIQMIYQGKEYSGKLEIDKLGRSRVFWHSDLGEQFRSFYHKESKSFPLIRFFRKENDRYEVEFIVDAIVTEEKKEPYETILQQTEGKKKEYYVTKYERNPAIRKKAIEIHGLKCMICGFDFEEKYGEAGRNFIEVHHTKPLFEINKEITVDPEADLVCICANCHRIIHRRRDKVYSVTEVKRMIEKKL